MPVNSSQYTEYSNLVITYYNILLISASDKN